MIDLMQLGKQAKKSAASLSLIITATEKNHLLSAMADTLERNRSRILTENKKDPCCCKNALNSTLIDRLELTDERIRRWQLVFEKSFSSLIPLWNRGQNVAQ